LENNKIYEFGNYSLNAAERLLLRSGEPVQIPPKAFDMLLMLVENNGRLLTKEEILKTVWHDSFVEESNLALNIHTLRKIFSEQNFIETVPKKGYRFRADVREIIPDHSPVVMEKRTITKIVKEEELEEFEEPKAKALPSATRFSKTALIAFSIVGLAIVSLAAWFLYHWNENRKTSEALAVRSMAVLPFKFVGNVNKEDEYLKVGLSDALITRLSNSRLIPVRPTSAIIRYDKPDVNPQTAGRELQVESVMEGNIQRVEDRVRVTIQLIRVEDGSVIWADKFEELSTNVLSLQDSISAQVVRTLALRLGNEEQALLAKQYTVNAEAQKLYLQGRFLWNQRTPDSLLKSINFFEQAKAKDTNYALAYIGLADSYQLLAEYRVMPTNEAFSKARAAATKALEIDPNLAEARTSLAYTLAFYDWNWGEAEKQFTKAIELNPNYATARQWYSEMLLALGRFDESFSQLKKAQELDPLSLIIQTDLAGYFYITRQYDQAIQQSNKIIELDPTFPFAYAFLWIAMEQKGEKEKAVETLLKSLPIWGVSNDVIEKRKEAYAKAGVRGYWQRNLDEINDTTKKDNSMAFDKAMFYYRVGDKEKTFEWLQKSCEARERWLINIKHDPQWDDIRNDPRFAELIKKID
jgi:DNA-binding winged helix-turn-helix (wHTH) protein/TolB-like protein